MTESFQPTVKVTDPERDPLYDEPDVEPDPEGTVEGQETDIPDSGEPDTEDHPAEWPDKEVPF